VVGVGGGECAMPKDVVELYMKWVWSNLHTQILFWAMK